MTVKENQQWFLYANIHIYEQEKAPREKWNLMCL